MPPWGVRFGCALPKSGACHCARENSFNTWAGTETTLGFPQAVDIRISRDMNHVLVVNSLLTAATTRPVQSSTGAPEAP